jgi:hypothetical protein
MTSAAILDGTKASAIAVTTTTPETRMVAPFFDPEYKPRESSSFVTISFGRLFWRRISPRKQNPVWLI